VEEAVRAVVAIIARFWPDLGTQRRHSAIRWQAPLAPHPKLRSASRSSRRTRWWRSHRRTWLRRRDRTPDVGGVRHRGAARRSRCR
jgi:hypothetical protein